MDLWLLEGFAAVEQHVGVRGLDEAVLHLSDRRVVEAVPRPGQSTVAQSRVVAHVQVPSVVLQVGGENNPRTKSGPIHLMVVLKG